MKFADVTSGKNPNARFEGITFDSLGFPIKVVAPDPTKFNNVLF